VKEERKKKKPFMLWPGQRRAAHLSDKIKKLSQGKRTGAISWKVPTQTKPAVEKPKKARGKVSKSEVSPRRRKCKKKSARKS